MKRIKRMSVFMLSVIMLFSTIVIFAEESTDVREQHLVTAVNLGDYLGENDGWTTISEETKLTFKNDSILTENEGVIVFGNEIENISDAFVQFNAKLSFKDEKGDAKWSGFSIREGKCGDKVWAYPADAYLFVIKSDRIELQRYKAGGLKVLDVVPNEYIKHAEEAEISVGAVNTDNGVCVVLFVDGVCVINAIDTAEEAVIKGNCINFYAPKGTVISKYTGDVISSVPTTPVIMVDNENGYKFKANYDLISFAGEAEDTYSIKWGFSTNKEGENLTELDKAAKQEFGSKYALIAEFEDIGVMVDEIEPTLEQANGYFVAWVLDADGNVVSTSASEKIEGETVLEIEADKLLSGSVALVVDYENAIVNGDKTQIDINDSNVMPTVIKGRTLVPVRFIAESFNANVGWDDATQKVTIELDGKTIVMTLNETSYTVDGEEKQLDVPATTIYNRTMVPVRAISEAFNKEVFWEEENELIIISNDNLGINVEKDMSILNYIAREIR